MNYNTMKNIIKKQIERYNNNSKEDIGIVISVLNNICIVSGLTTVMLGEKVIGDNGIIGIVLSLKEDHFNMLVFEGDVKESVVITRTKKLFYVNFTENIIGHVVDYKLESLNNNEVDKTETKELTLEKEIPDLKKRDFVSESLLTGILAVDSLIPIGKGQRQLIIGNKTTGKSIMALDMIINQKHSDVICIYVGIGQKNSHIKRVEDILRDKKAMNYTVIITSNASDSSAKQYITPYVGISVAEEFTRLGRDVLLIFDDLTKHAVAYREISLLLGCNGGREAYPGDIFYLHSRLLERGGKFAKNFRHGKSITIIPVVETFDISSYISTNIISITDGQIFLEENLFNKNIKPAINVGMSVSRIGGNAQPKIMKEVCKTMKIQIASIEELENFHEFSTDLDEKTKQILEKGRLLNNLLKQNYGNPYELWEEVILIYGVTNDYIISLENIRDLLNYIKDFHSEIIDMINKEDNTKEIINEIKKVLQNYVTTKS
ncbi:F0F1 ATP synthase subunit alpha [Rickettsiales bacterium (ex Bugula neritina AB1)]|nr:F0F1 ATP synthase subunit alpha [Rickettsiales bacterium (ex Bugula neritina AB1)]